VSRSGRVMSLTICWKTANRLPSSAWVSGSTPACSSTSSTT